LMKSLVMVGKIGVIGLLAAIGFAAVPLGFSALSTNRKHTLAIWAGYYWIGGGILNLVAVKTDLPWLSALDLKLAIGGLSLSFFDFGFTGRSGGAAPMWAALVGLLGLSTLSLAAAYWRVRQAEREGLGGG
ncbi:MAG: hypothetical protein KJO07_08460, partial [Deltaproteobacteria bacterium]|nr:hypothetical protein [Deltaproteobacteria bacterium]